MEGVLRARAVRRWVGERVDDLELLDDRAGPPVRDDERQRAVMLRADMDDVDVDPIDLGDELRKGLQSRLHPAPVVVRRPMASEFPHRRELHTLRPIRDGLAFRPPRGRDTPPQLGKLLVGDADLEGADLGAGLDSAAHGILL